MFFKSLLSLSALLVLVSAMTLERNGKSYSEVGHLGTITHTIAAEITIFVDSVAPGFKGTQAPSYSRTHRTVSDDSTGPSFLASKSDCEKEDEDDCKEFCGLSEQTGTCRADGNKVTCYCKGGKSDSNCEERCLLCMSRAPFPRISL